MLRPMVAATAALVIAGSSIVYAQQHFGDSGGYRDGGSRLERHHWSVDDVRAFADARIAALRAGLTLTPDQEKNWPAFEQAMRALVELRIQSMQARQARMAAGEQQRQATNPFDRLQHWAEAMSERGVALRHLADAGAPLYGSLSDAQKQRFKMLARILRPHHPMHAGTGQGWRDGHGYGNDGGRDGRWREGQGYGRDSHGGGEFHESSGSEDEGEQL